MGIETVGRRIKRERIALGWTQRQLADTVGVGVPYVSKIEAERETPSDELLMRIGQALNVDPDELLIVARRLPDEVAERFASNPAEAVRFLRSWSEPKA